MVRVYKPIQRNRLSNKPMAKISNYMSIYLPLQTNQKLSLLRVALPLITTAVDMDFRVRSDRFQLDEYITMASTERRYNLKNDTQHGVNFNISKSVVV